MGADKAWLAFGGESLIERAVRRAAAQAAPLVISANGDLERFGALGPAVVRDAAGPNGPLRGGGPLAGIVSAMARLRNVAGGADRVASFACDTPFFPGDLVARLSAAFRPRTIAVAASAGRLHPTFALWPAMLEGDLLECLAREPVPSMQSVLERFGFEAVDFAALPFDPFLNINTPAELEFARKLLAGR